MLLARRLDIFMSVLKNERTHKVNETGPAVTRSMRGLG
jgi:hypothetical protein